MYVSKDDIGVTLTNLLMTTPTHTHMYTHMDTYTNINFDRRNVATGG